MNLQDGTLLQGGKYKIVRHISSGGFGNTYEALDVNLDKRVAIKEFFVKDFCSRESDTTLVTIASTAKKPLIEHLKKKFIEEARAIAKMEHENIVKVQALFEENGTAYYVMDYIDGESLSALLKRCGSLPEKKAVTIILKVADALDYMHKQNRFHLDVKPANIMIRKDGKVILIDFGSSKQYAEVDGENTTTLAPCYTTGYAPSEQMNPKPTAFTAATDVYSLGATLFKMLTGQTPPSAIDLQNEEAFLSSLPQEVSQNIRVCVEKAMIPQRNKRTQSVKEFAELLGKQELNVGTSVSYKYKWMSKIFNIRYHLWLNLLLSAIILYSAGVAFFAIIVAGIIHPDYSMSSLSLTAYFLAMFFATITIHKGKWTGLIILCLTFLIAITAIINVYNELLYETEKYVWTMLTIVPIILLLSFLCLRKNGVSGWNVLSETKPTYFKISLNRKLAFIFFVLSSAFAIIFGFSLFRQTSDQGLPIPIKLEYFYSDFFYFIPTIPAVICWSVFRGHWMNLGSIEKKGFLCGRLLVYYFISIALFFLFGLGMRSQYRWVAQENFKQSSYRGWTYADSTHVEKIIAEGVEFNMCYVNEGNWAMGNTIQCNFSNPVHLVYTTPFYISETKVTQELWNAIMNSEKAAIADSTRNKDISFVDSNWEQCQEFIRRLSYITGKKFRLPTEAEWEYAARCGALEKRRLSYSSKNVPNELGIYDMIGGHEWCSDIYDWLPNLNHQINPQGPTFSIASLLRLNDYRQMGDTWHVIRYGVYTPEGKACRTAGKEKYDDSVISNACIRLVMEP